MGACRPLAKVDEQVRVDYCIGRRQQRSGSLSRSNAHAQYCASRKQKNVHREKTDPSNLLLRQHCKQISAWPGLLLLAAKAKGYETLATTAALQSVTPYKAEEPRLAMPHPRPQTPIAP